MTPEEERDAKNRAIVEALRETFTPVAQRLTPDIEPATAYVIAEPESVRAMSEAIGQ